MTKTGFCSLQPEVNQNGSLTQAVELVVMRQWHHAQGDSGITHDQLLGIFVTLRGADKMAK